MKDNKNKVILFLAIIIVIIIIVILAVVYGKKEEGILEGEVKVIASLQGNSQAEIDNQIKDDLEEKGYGLSNAKVYINPYGHSPLSALIAFKTENETDVVVTIKGKNNDDIVLKYGKETYHYIPVYALYQNHNNTVNVKLGTGESKNIDIKIDALTYDIGTTVNQSEETLGNDIYFITSPIAMSSFAVDAHGEVRWATDEMYYHEVRVLDNGHLLIGTADINDDALNTKLIEIDYLGRVYNEYNIPEGYLNNFYIKKDGNIILASKKEDRDSFSEYIIEIDDETGKIVKTWDILELLERVDSSFTNGIDRSEFFYNSGIEYYEDTDSLVLTYWGGEFVINVSYKDSSIKWIFSNPDNFTSGFESVLLKAPEGFVYPKSMHSATLDDKILKVFDNGYSTNANDANSANLIGSYSSANTYKIDGKNITLVSSYDEDKTLFSYALGDYEIVTNNDEILLFGRELKGLDYSRGIDINNYDDAVTRLIEKQNGRTVLDMEINWASHMVKKIDLDGSYTFDFTTPASYTTLTPSKKENLTSSMVSDAKNATETVDYEFGYSELMIEHNVLFMTDDEAKLVLINDNENGAVYTLKVKGETDSKRIVTDLAKGKYYVYVLENGTMYKTDRYIEIN